MQTNNNNGSKLGQGHSFQNHMSKIWLIAIGIAFIAGILLPIFFLHWFYGKDFWSEYGLLRAMIKNGEWQYFNYLNVEHSAVMLSFYFLIENIILLEIIFMYAAFKIVKAEEKRHINIEAKYREKINSEAKDKDFEKKISNKDNEKKENKFNLE